MRLVLCTVLLFLPIPGLTQQAPPPAGVDPALLQKVVALCDEEKWEFVLQLIPPSDDLPPELDYYRGVALAGLQRWKEARQTLESGRVKAPRDKRFAVELAGVAFRQGDRKSSRRLLRQALRLDPHDSYANDFLASIYHLDGDQEAAIYRWNRVGKPMLEEIRIQPMPRTNPVLVDHCFAFSPAGRLRWEEWRATQARLEALQVFPSYRLELTPRKDGKFDSVLRPLERNGWGNTLVEGLISLLRGLPYRTVLPEYYNLRKSAVNLRGLIRWDPEKRRADLSFSAPIAREPAWRFTLHADGRDENWDIAPSLKPHSSVTVPFNMRTLKADAGIESLAGWRWKWGTSIEASRRDYAGQPAAPGTAPVLFAEGVGVEQSWRIECQTLSLPESRVTLLSIGSGRWGKILTGSTRPYGSLGGGAALRWFPKARGADYQVDFRLSAMRSFGDLPFDKYFSLGLDRDNLLLLRGHKGTEAGRKGAGPLGSHYVLVNLEVSKPVYRKGLMEIALAPFLDSGRAFDGAGYFGSPEWLWDVGVQVRLEILKRVSVVLSYGRDLRSGRNALYSSTY